MSNLLHAGKSPSPVIDPPTPQRAEAWRHELQVHQIELKMQNEALREALAALEASRDSYQDLYEFAPVDYLTLSVDGLIKGINLTGTKLLNRDRERSLKTRSAQHVLPAGHAAGHRFFRQALLNSNDLIGEVEIKRNGADCLVVALKCAAVRHPCRRSGQRLGLLLAIRARPYGQVPKRVRVFPSLELMDTLKPHPCIKQASR